MSEIVLILASIDPLPEARSSTPNIAGAAVRVAFAAILGATVLGIPASTNARASAGVAGPFHAGVGPLSAEDDGDEKWTAVRIPGVRAATFAYARVLVDGLPTSVPEPHLSSSDDGEIGLSWTIGRDRFEAIVDPDDRLVWVSKVNGKYGEGGDVSVLSESDRDVFYFAVRAFYGRS